MKINKLISLLILISFIPITSLFSADKPDYETINNNLTSEIEDYATYLNTGVHPPTTPLAFKKGEPYISAGTSAGAEKNLIRVAAYDVGSTGVKFKVADVDVTTNNIVNDIFSTTKNTEKLGFDIDESNYMDRIAIMAGLKSIVEEFFPYLTDVKHVAIATAGFRKAGEKGVKLAKMITEMVGIDFEIINQNDEGLLAYYGVIAKVKDFDSSKDIVWDIGGGSSQIVLSENVNGKDELKFYGVEVGGNRFNEFIRQVVKAYSAEDLKNKKSVNPLTKEEAADAISFSKYLLTTDHDIKELHINPFTSNDLNTIKNKISQGGKVYAIGAVHNFVAKLYADKVVRDSFRNYYTKDDIKKALDAVVGKDDTEIRYVFKDQKGDIVFVNSDITSLILVYSMMDVLGLDRVYPINASNTDGLIIKTALEQKAKAEAEREKVAAETARQKAAEAERQRIASEAARQKAAAEAEKIARLRARARNQ